MKKVLIASFIVSLFFVSATLASGVADSEARGFVNTSEITIGEKITYTIEVDAPKEASVEFPDIDITLGGFAIKDFGIAKPRKIGKGNLRYKRWYLLDTYTVGSYVIPEQAIKIVLPDTETYDKKTPEIFVEVKSVMAEGGEDEGLRDIKAPVSVPRDVSGWIIAIISIVVLLVLALAGSCVLRLSDVKRISSSLILSFLDLFQVFANF